MDRDNWLAGLKIGDEVAVTENCGRSPEVWRGRVGRFTATQILVDHKIGTSTTRFRRKDGYEIDAVYGHRRIEPAK
jgi:hypothetical protein